MSDSDVYDLGDESEELIVVVELLEVVNEGSHSEAGEDGVWFSYNLS